MAMLLVSRNRDVSNKRRPLRYQLGQLLVAALLALFYVAPAQLFFENGVCD